MARPVVGPVLIGIGVIHLACTPLFQPAAGGIVRAGLLGGVQAETVAATSAREAAFWYVVAGGGVLILGGLAWWAEHRLGVLPAGLGWALIGLALAGLVLGPVSGFWLFLVPGSLVLLRRRRSAQTALRAGPSGPHASPDGGSATPPMGEDTPAGRSPPWS